MRWRLAGFVAAAPVVALALAACSGGGSPSGVPPTASPAPSKSSTTATTSARSVEPEEAGLAVFAACQSDYRVVQSALAAYLALNAAEPIPPATWSAATYGQNWSPLTASGKGGPFLASAPSPAHFVIEYDASGHVWIEPPGRFDPTYNPARAASDDVCALVSH
jgi:hypothetical protein